MTPEELLVSITSNPLLLLAAGAGISGLLVPYFTRRWQDRQEELRLKVNLILDLSKAVTKILRAVESTEEGIKTLEKFKDSKEEWFLKTPDIGSQIHTYFYKSRWNIRDFWENYKKAIGEYCKLTELQDAGKREASLHEINQRLSNIDKIKGQKNSKKEYDGDDKLFIEKLTKFAKRSDLGELKKLVTRLDTNSDSDYTRVWKELHQKMFDLKHDLMKLIIVSHIAGFSRDLSDYFHKK